MDAFQWIEFFCKIWKNFKFFLKKFHKKSLIFEMKKMSKKNFFFGQKIFFFFIQILIKNRISWILIKYFYQKHHQNHRNSHKFDDFYIKIIDFDENLKKKVACGGRPHRESP